MEGGNCKVKVKGPTKMFKPGEYCKGGKILVEIVYSTIVKLSILDFNTEKQISNIIIDIGVSGWKQSTRNYMFENTTDYWCEKVIKWLENNMPENNSKVSTSIKPAFLD